MNTSVLKLQNMLQDKNIKKIEGFQAGLQPEWYLCTLIRY